ncbi:hypothetical protein YC2023_019371 [Brassica napus]
MLAVVHLVISPHRYPFLFCTKSRSSLTFSSCHLLKSQKFVKACGPCLSSFNPKSLFHCPGPPPNYDMLVEEVLRDAGVPFLEFGFDIYKEGNCEDDAKEMNP